MIRRYRVSGIDSRCFIGQRVTCIVSSMITFSLFALMPNCNFRNGKNMIETELDHRFHRIEKEIRLCRNTVFFWQNFFIEGGTETDYWITFSTVLKKFNDMFKAAPFMAQTIEFDQTKFFNISIFFYHYNSLSPIGRNLLKIPNINFRFPQLFKLCNQ